MGIDVVEEVLGHGLLKELAKAFQEGDGVVVLGGGVVVTTRLGDDNDQSSLPRGGVVTNPDAGVGEGGEVVLCGGPGHFEDAPSLSREAGGRLAGGFF